MNDENEKPVTEPQVDNEPEFLDQDDRYPGSFFRMPGLPIPGKTTWSLN